MNDKEFKFVCELIWGGVPIDEYGKPDKQWADDKQIFKEKAPLLLERYPQLDESFFAPTTLN